MLKNLWNVITGSSASVTSKVQPITLESGKLYKLAKNGVWQCQFLECQIELKPVASIPFQYQLWITKVVEEGEEENLEDDACSDDENEFIFLVDVQCHFQRESGLESATATSTTAPNPKKKEEDSESAVFVFSFSNVTDGTNYRIELMQKEYDEMDLQLFELNIARACYERLFNKPVDIDDEDQLMDWYQLQVTGESASKPSNKVDEDNSVSNVATVSTAAPESNNSLLVAHKPLPNETVIFHSTWAKFFFFDGSTGSFVLQDAQVKIIISKIVDKIKKEHDDDDDDDEEEEFVHFRWKVCGVLRTYTDQELDSTLNIVTQKDHCSVIWNFHAKTGDALSTWSLSCQFPKMDDLNALIASYSSCLYESMNDSTFEKGVKKEESNYVMRALTGTADVEMNDVYPDENDDSKEEEEETDEEESLLLEEEADDNNPFLDDDDDEDASDREEHKSNERNEHLAVAYKHDRTFVVRGSQIGIFKNTVDGRDQGLSYQGRIKNIGDLKGKSFEPSQVMLHEGDNSMLFLSRDNNEKIFKMDLERGQIVEEYNVDTNLSIKGIIPDSKYAQMTPGKTFVGFNHNHLFRVDPRMNGTKYAEGKQYVSKNEFSCAVTNGRGELAIASDKGDIRLFNKLNVRAKTHLPAFGDAILGIDSTEDGKYVLATCKNYLLLIKTEIEDGSSGFTKSISKHVQAPVRLQLRPEHAAFIGTISFTPAKFNIGSVGPERSIVVSTGPFVITWNFRRVRAGHLYDYTIKQYQDAVVADQFKYDDTRAVIVALPNDVKISDVKSFVSPKKLYGHGAGGSSSARSPRAPF